MKVGDRVFVKIMKVPVSSGYLSQMQDFQGKVFTITECFSSGQIYLDDGGWWLWNEEWLEELVLNNSLNKKLYPDRVEHKGFLLPAKTAAKLSEQE